MCKNLSIYLSIYIFWSIYHYYFAMLIYFFRYTHHLFSSFTIWWMFPWTCWLYFCLACCVCLAYETGTGCMRFDVASILADYDICCQNLTVHICSDCPDRDCYRDPKSKWHHTRAWSVGIRLGTQIMQIDNDTNIVVRVILWMQRQCFRMWRGRLHPGVTFLQAKTN